MGKSKKIGIAAAIIVGVIVILGISPYFFNTTIDEALPMEAESIDVQEMTKSSGTFVGVGDGIHDAAGEAMVLSIDDTQYLRFENFKSTNGPDLYVYLSTDEQAFDYVPLGKLKANMGNQNYEIPSDVDLEKYNKVLIWCQAFSVLFGSAELN
jgi:hypothetical protein